jgi:hypothetical protein
MQFEAPPKVTSDPYRTERVFMERHQPSRITSSD